MIIHLAKDQRRGGSDTVEARKRRRMTPTLMALEDRRLLSTFTVNSTLDNGSAGTLRWAVGQANSAGGAETIAFDSKVFKSPQTITLQGTQLELSDTTGTETITGPKAGVTVSGGGLSRVFQVDGAVTASISGLTITGGKAANGGGLYNDNGTVTLTDCTVSGNSVIDGGGGLYNFKGTAKLTNCTVSGNHASEGGGGLYNRDGGTATLSKCTVSGNYGYFGGGVGNLDGTATLTNTTVSGNSAGSGGGLNNEYGTAKLTNCIVSGNSAIDGGGLYTGGSGKVTLSYCTVSTNSASYGGGVYNSGSKALLTNCTVSGNSATVSGGGLFNLKGYYASSATLTNCTVSGNSAAVNGGGLFNGNNSYGAAKATLTTCTVSGNSALDGGGIANQGTLNRLLRLLYHHEPGVGRGGWHRHDLWHGDDLRFLHQQQPCQLIGHRARWWDLQQEQRSVADQLHASRQPGERRDGPGRGHLCLR